MVGSVRSGVVFEGVYLSVADAANGAPEKGAEINNQIRGHAVHLFVQFLGSENLRFNFISVFISNRLESITPLITRLVVILLCNSSVCLAACDVYKHTRVISRVAPCFPPAPLSVDYATGRSVA